MCKNCIENFYYYETNANSKINTLQRAGWARPTIKSPTHTPPNKIL